MQTVEIKTQSDRAEVERFCILICHIDLWPLICEFLYYLRFNISRRETPTKSGVLH